MDSRSRDVIPRMDLEILSSRRSLRFSGIALLALCGLNAASAADFRERLPEDEIVYFLLPDRFENGDRANDRGGLRGDRLKTGFDPTHKGFYHGGDLKGLTARLDYIQALGATAIWLGPIYKNKPVQGAPGEESAGYHGYWITDFTRVDPHFGTNEDMKTLRGGGACARPQGLSRHHHQSHRGRDRVSRMPGQQLPVSLARGLSVLDGGRTHWCSPSTRASRETASITAENFAKLTRADFCVHTVRARRRRQGESSRLAQRSDLVPQPRRLYVQRREHHDGRLRRPRRSDDGESARRSGVHRHLRRLDRSNSLWTVFASIPRSTSIRSSGRSSRRRCSSGRKARGIPNFHIFGEVFTSKMDPALLARATRVDRLPSVLDFAFRAALVDVVAGDSGADTVGGAVQRATHCMKAARRRRSGCRLSSAITTSAGMRTIVRKAFPQADDDRGSQTRHSGARDDVHAARRAGRLFGR